MPKYLIFFGNLFQQIRVMYLSGIEMCAVIHRIQWSSVSSVRWIIPVLHHKNITDPDPVKISQKIRRRGFLISRNVQIYTFLK